MKLSIYTCVKDGLFYDYHVEAMLRHHLPLVDEIIVNDGGSQDGTFEIISNIDPKIKVFQSDWGKPTGLSWLADFKNVARKRCTGDWCINLDCDEFIPEWEFAELREHLTNTDAGIVPLKIINYYANYKVFHQHPQKVPWPDVKQNIHRNVPTIEVVGDGSNVKSMDGAYRVDDPPRFSCHHFGFVRNPARLRQKWRNVLGNLYIARAKGRQKWFKLPSFLFNLCPHNWMDPQYLDDLAIYDGPFVQPVVDDPGEFTRDKMKMYKYLDAQRNKSAANA
ncbi:MAG: glycosyltransferase family 2 protein [Planctomycetota bacterium]|nr:glycosyltransferase family 2 protein [Planctomycetota bacterium]